MSLKKMMLGWIGWPRKGHQGIDFSSIQTVMPDDQEYDGALVIKEALAQLMGSKGLFEGKHYRVVVKQRFDAAGVIIYNAYVTLMIYAPDALIHSSTIEASVRRIARTEMVVLYTMYWRLDRKIKMPDQARPNTTSPSALFGLSELDGLSVTEQEWPLTQPGDAAQFAVLQRS